MTSRPLHKRYSVKEVEARRDASPLQDVLSVSEVAYYWGLSTKAVQNAIGLNKLITRKVDAPEGANGGFYLIERKSCDQLWGRRLFDAYSDRYPTDAYEPKEQETDHDEL